MADSRPFFQKSHPNATPPIPFNTTARLTTSGLRAVNDAVIGRCPKPKMNAHCERFNRTIQEEFVDYHAHALLEPQTFNVMLMEYLVRFNTERPHYALELQSPLQFLLQWSSTQ